jgi:hypothetical protein
VPPPAPINPPNLGRKQDINSFFGLFFRFLTQFEFGALRPVARARKRRVEDADLREDPDGEDHHPRGGEQRHHRQRQGQNPGACCSLTVLARGSSLLLPASR